MTLLRICFALVILFACNAWAESAPIGSVNTVSGDARIVTAGVEVRAALGVPVYMGSQLKTGKKSSLGIVFNDATVMSFGSDTELSIDEYLYQPNSDKQKLAGKLLKGSMNYLSGAIAKLHPESVSFRTPTGTLGVRGTHVLALVGSRSYVTLIANPDGTVGKVIIQGPRGVHLIDKANFGAPLDGSAAPSAIETSVIQQDFGEAIAARPVQPPIPTGTQGLVTDAESLGTAGARAQAAAVGSLSGSALTVGVVVVGAVVQASQSATGTTGSH